ncbi:protein of unknown function [Taphrina deformans PYCC 5710]|uniref:Aminoglycoside phosphotransferase domain-containing protein n=1 Tax=Taphrina deformans (strain PYCC 5710 / ATCC 11124 / CBS 356.35 / IMI 108563 / JCM 9778 / NBRC 8474) TaxID=1097556 RepID=R4XGV3_TAPDE|nr:protein of unknown function [Taphrina deformans PYCC 5710]|eukprot:CCG85026.1 protein of unknown function [Taphrina deformans PYCC 5710]
MFRTTDNIGNLRERIDLDQLQRYIEQAAPSICIPIRLSQFLHGQSNPTLLITDAQNQQYVLRKKPPGELMSQTAHAIEREHKIMSALQGTGIPVPKMHCLCEDKSVLGTPFYIMEFLRGRIFTDPALPSLSPSERNACWFSAIDTLAKMHQVNIDSVSLADYGRASAFYERQLKTFAKLSPIQAEVTNGENGSVVGPIPHWHELTAWFRMNLPQDRTSIVHGDFKMDNCVFHETEPRVVGILDWELSTIGHPLSDLANLLQPYGLPSGGESSLTGFAGRNDLQGVPTLSEAHARYSAIAKWSSATDWTFAEAFAHLRLAVITQGIAARVARKQASSLKAIHHAQLFRPLGELAWIIIQADTEDGQEKAKL